MEMMPSISASYCWNSLFRVICVASSVAAPLVLPRAACAGSVVAFASGNFPSFGPSDVQQQQDSDISASVTETLDGNLPGHDWIWHSTAFASYGLLETEDDVSGTNMGSFNNGIARAESQAEFFDKWMFTGRPQDSAGQFRIAVHFDGAAFQSPGANAIVQSYGQLNIALLPLDKFSDIVDGQHGFVSTGQITGAVDTTYVTDAISFLYGEPIKVQGVLAGSVRIIPKDFGSAFSGSGLSQFGHTAAITSVEVRDANGNWTTDFSLETGATFLYPFEAAAPAPVPEPSSLILMAGLAVLTGAGRRGRRRDLHPSA
jgi:hypothetical protein